MIASMLQWGSWSVLKAMHLERGMSDAAMISRHIDCDSSRAQQELAYRFTPVRQLLEETCDWMRSEGLLT